MYGNFPNYYYFNDVENRIALLRDDIVNSLESTSNNYFSVLDVGCNSGSLTIALCQLIAQRFPLKCIAIDIDASLIERACSRTIDLDIQFKQSNICTDLNELIDEFNGKCDLVCMFSVGMWLHLQLGDEEYDRLIGEIVDNARFILIEQHNFSSYKKAKKKNAVRVSRKFMSDVLEEKGAKLKWDFGTNKWNRRMLLYETELVGLSHKPFGWPLQYPRMDNYINVEFTKTMRHLQASAVHHSGRVLISASTSEHCIKKHLASTTDQFAAKMLGQVLAKRLRMFGIRLNKFENTMLKSEKEKIFREAIDNEKLDNEPEFINSQYLSHGIDYDRLAANNRISKEKSSRMYVESKTVEEQECEFIWSRIKLHWDRYPEKFVKADKIE